MLSEEFGHTTWLDIDILKQNISNLDYDLLLVDAGADRVGIYDNINIFNNNIPIIFDDTMDEKYLKCANLLSNKLNKKIETFQCEQNKYCVHWWEGKKYSLLI